MWEAFIIIVALGGLEFVLWWIDRRELTKQTELLEDILVTLATNQPEPPGLSEPNE